MKNIIFTLGGYKPNMSANGICVDKVIQDLKGRGYSADCISYHLPDTPEHEVVDGVHVHRIRPTRNYWYADKMRKAADPKIKNRYRQITRAFDYLSVLLDVFSYPRESVMRSRRMFRAAEQVVREKESAVIVGVNFPIDSVYAAYKIKEKYPEIKFIIYGLDPLSGGKFCKLLGRKRSLRRARENERRLLEAADAAVFQLEHREYFEKNYSPEINAKLRFLGVPLLVNKDSDDVTTDRETVLFAGTLSKKTRNPQFIFDVFRYTKKAKLVMYALNNVDDFREMAGDNPNVVINGKIPYEQLQDEYAAAAAFLNIGNSQSVFAPSKIIEYIGYGKPVISTYRTDHDTCGKFMEKLPCGLYLDERTGMEDPQARLQYLQQAAAQIDALLEDSSEPLGYSKLAELFRENTPAAFTEIIEEQAEEGDYEQE